MAAPARADAAGTADVSVTLSVREPATYDEPGPVVTQPLYIPDRVWFVFEVTNHGPDTASVRLDIQSTGSPYRGSGYDNWTIPISKSGAYWDGGMRDCDYESMVCNLTLGSGSSYRVIQAGTANAPGRFEIGTTLATDTNDPNLSNNTASWSTQVLCSVAGTPGDDVLIGTSETEAICGFGGNDRLIAVGGRDDVFGGPGDDLFLGRGDDHNYIGGDGRDTISFARSKVAVAVWLDDEVSDAARHLMQIETVIGSRWADYLEGRGRGERLVGRRGDDLITGGGGRDSLVGGPGNDEFRSRDAARDSVSGGDGRDQAWVDSRDRLRSVRVVQNPPFAPEE